jgi:Family of unknown function (DUF6152)
MKFVSAVVTVAVAAALHAQPATAHHAANAQFDVSQLKTIKGKLAKVDWVNPHAWFHFDVTNPDGTTTRWSFETGGPAQMRRMGMSGAGMMPVGQEYTISYRPARDGSNTGLMSVLVFPDGRKFSQLPSQ